MILIFLPNALWIISFLLFFQIVFSLALGSFPHVCSWSVLCWILLWNYLPISGVLSVKSLFSCILSMNSCWLDLPELSHLHFLNSGSPLGFSWVFPLHTSLWNSFNTVVLGNHRAYVIIFCLSEITIFCCLISSFLQCAI